MRPTKRITERECSAIRTKVLAIPRSKRLVLSFLSAQRIDGFLGPLSINMPGIKVMDIKNAAATPKLEKIPNSKMGTTEVKQKETKPAKVVRAAKKTGLITSLKALITCSLCSSFEMESSCTTSS